MKEAPINFGFRISDFEKRASYSENGIGGNARPHPGPLPQERGKHAQFPKFSRPLVWNCFMGTHVGCYEVQAEDMRHLSGNEFSLPSFLRPAIC